jgi:hypothetical protein
MPTEMDRAQQETAQLSAEIDAIVTQVKGAILELEKDSPAGGAQIQLKSAELTLNVAVTKSVGGDFKFQLFGHGFGGGAELTKVDTQTITLKLKPHGALAFAAVPGLQARLVNALRAIRDSVAAAAISEPKFDLDETTVELNFEIDKHGEISFIVTGEGKTVNAQTITLTLGKA